MNVLQSSKGDSTITKSEHPKLLIPRWGKPRVHEIHYHGGVEKRRVTHACEPCREKKTKCDGGRPLCHHCRISGSACHYGDGKRERAKKNLKTLESRIAVLEGLIHGVQPYLSSARQLVVQEILSQSSPRIYSPRQVSTSIASASSCSFSRQNSEGSTGESFFSAGIRSVSPFDLVISDAGVKPVANPVEHLGKPNETLWIGHVSKELKKTIHDEPTSVLELLPSHEAIGINLSGREMGLPRQRKPQGSSLEGPDIPVPLRQVDMFSLPPRSVADKLISSYFTTVHPLFPIICRPHFIAQFSVYYNSLEQKSPESSRKWLTVLNLVFAIGDKYLDSELGIEGRDQSKDVDYFMRSRILGALDGGSVFEIPDLGKVQALGLTGIYLLASVQTNRAWNVIGLAIRLAHGIGLHLRNDGLAEGIQKEMRLRIWYCLCCLETNLCLITGRPSAIQDGSSSAPCPSNLNDEILPSEYSNDSTLDTYFSEHRGLTVISADMLYLLYSAKSPRDQDWPQVHGSIQRLSTRLEQWRMRLPPALDFLNEEVDYVFRRQRLNLVFQYYTIRMLIYRPCLYPTEVRILNESSELREFQKISAAACISSARAITHLIVDAPDHKSLVHNSPWWCLLHYLMPAKAIIVLEMAYQTTDTPEYKATLFSDSTLILEWLKRMSKMSTGITLRGHILELTSQLKKEAPRIEVQFRDKGEDEWEGITSHLHHPTPPSIEYQASLPHSPSSVSEEGPHHSTQEQCFNFTRPLAL